MWLQLDTDLLDQPRWLNLSLPARLWYVALLGESLKRESGCLPVIEWSSTRMMRGKLGLAPDEYPQVTADSLLEELAGPSTHLIDVENGQINVHGFEDRYRTMIEKRRKDAERKRAARRAMSGAHPPDVRSVSAGHPEAQERASTGRPMDVPRTSAGRPQDVAGTSKGRLPDGAGSPRVEGARSPRVDVDVDVDVEEDSDVDVYAHGECSPPLTLDGSVANPPLTSRKAGLAHTEPGTPTETPHHTTPEKIPTSEPANSILEGWFVEEKYGKAVALRQLANVVDHSDPIFLLAHLREIEAMDEAVSKCAVLWIRLMPGKDGKRMLPSETALKDAKTELNSDDDGPRGGAPSSPAHALKDLVSKPTGRLPNSVVASIFEGLTSGWSGPNDRNHDGEKTIAQGMLASDPCKVIAYACQINATEIMKGTEPWGKIAEMCSLLAKPRRKYVEEAEKLALADGGKAGK
jgi:hypothetical protein